MVMRTDAKAGHIPRSSAYLDIGEMLSGALLIIFMTFHLILVGTIIIGPEAFGALSEWLEETFYLAFITLGGVAILFVAHVVLAVSKIPTNWNKHARIYQISRNMNHFDTFLWIVQVVTGVLVGFLAVIHLWVIATTFPITPEKSALRMAGDYNWYYIILVLIVDTHLAVGFYRIICKWGFWSRKFQNWFFYLLLLIFWTIGLTAHHCFVKYNASLMLTTTGGGG